MVDSMRGVDRFGSARRGAARALGVACAGAALGAWILVACSGAARAPADTSAVSCPTANALNVVLPAAPNALESLCTDASPPTLSLAVTWAPDGAATGNGYSFQNVQCADGSIGFGCPPPVQTVQPECLAVYPGPQPPCPYECMVVLFAVGGTSDLNTIGTIDVVSYADGAPEFVLAQQGSCIYQQSF